MNNEFDLRICFCSECREESLGASKYCSRCGTLLTHAVIIISINKDTEKIERILIRQQS